MKLRKIHTLAAVFGLILIISGLFSTPAFAQVPTSTGGGSEPLDLGDIPLIVPIPTATGTQGNVPTPGAYFKQIFLYAIGLAALLALAQLTFGAVQYTASAGFPALQEASKDRIKNGIVGLILLIGAVTILTMFYNPGVSEFSPSSMKSTPRTSTIDDGSKAVLEEDLRQNGEIEYQKIKNGTFHEMRETWKVWWRDPYDIRKDPGDAELLRQLVKTLHAIEDNASYDLANNPAGRAGYLAARRVMFRDGIIPNEAGGTYKEAPALFQAYVNSRRPPSWATLQEIDLPIK